MADELYPGYDPMIDPNPVTCWGMPTAEEMEECNRRSREMLALWMFDDNFEENGFLHSANWAETKKQFMKTNPWL